MKVKVTEDFKAAPEGHTVVSVAKGDIVSGRLAEMALRMECGEEYQEAEETPKPKKKAPKKAPKKSPKPKVAKKPKPDHEG